MPDPRHLTAERLSEIVKALAARTPSAAGGYRPTQQDLAARFGVSQATISAIAAGRHYLQRGGGDG